MTNHSSTDWKALFLRFETLLVAVLLAEIIIFSSTAENFATTTNSLEIIRLSVELGLLALVMTPIILTGGIDLSVGSLLGLCAISFGKLWRDGGLPPALAAICTLLIGAAAGGLNALLITRLKLPPLIVTLGSFSLFRGLAEAITRGVDNFTGFPPSFLFLGQGYFFGIDSRAAAHIGLGGHRDLAPCPSNDFRPFLSSDRLFSRGHALRRYSGR